MLSLFVAALCVVRFLRTFLDELVKLRIKADVSLLAARMSQLKPLAWKTPALFAYGIVTLLLVGATIVGLLVIGVRDALRDDG
ncbi:MAG: hypothetical protein ABI321_05470 [Polyangia bacterium]